ncbi:hypothetical protein [Flexivirga alba]|uniref:Uncharacterized protein n=1 Tax=Flexivirga alba TaxID=702742 RepID=A0ABW2AGL8_9MICO
MNTPVLTVPAPALKFDDAGGGAAVLEKPVTVLLGPVTAAGDPVAPSALTGFGFAVVRRRTAGAATEVWDDQGKHWLPDTPASAATPIALAYRVGDPAPWQGMLVAGGATDSAGAPAFAKAAGGYPQYTVRGAFTATGGSPVAGPSSTPFTLVGAADKNLIVVGAGPDESPTDATQIRVLLKNTALQEIGGLVIDRDSPGAAVTIRNAAGASVLLRADGGVEVHPAPGRGVLIAGDLEAERVTYRPAGGGPKRVLS